MADQWDDKRADARAERAGDAHDWRRLFTEQAQQQGGFYFRLALRIVGESGAAEDVCQRAFLGAWRQRARIARAEAIRGYLARAVVNEALQWRRRRQTERAALHQLPPRDGPNTDPGAGVEQREWVWRAMEQLHEPTRSVVIMRIVHGLKGKEVSERLSCSASEVSRRLHAGLDTLRRAMHKQQPAPQEASTTGAQASAHLMDTQSTERPDE